MLSDYFRLGQASLLVSFDNYNMKNKIFLVFLFIQWGTLQAKVNFSSPVVKKVAFSIGAGTVLTKSPNPHKNSVQNQLKYLFGALNEIDSGVDFPSLTIEIESIKSNNGYSEIHFNAKGSIAWDSKRQIPKTLNIVLPKRGDEEGLTAFVNKYQEKCARKPSSLATFWNYYRPNKANCPLKDNFSQDTILLSVHLEESPISHTRREPNYRQIFDDNTLEISAIITKDDIANSQDISIWEFNNLCQLFSTNALTFYQIINECHSESHRNGLTIKVHVFLVDNFNDRPDLFLQKISPYLLSSDVVSFNGHSGMGVNIESWLKLYPVPKDKYQIIFLNSCDTYGYFRNEFFDQFKAINQAESSSEYLDVILNATPNYFGTFADSNSSIILGLSIGLNFNEILSKLPTSQHSLLLNE